MTGWSYAGEPAALGSAGVTLVEGSSFCLCETTGDIRDGTPQGVFFQDTRILDRWVLSLDGEPVQSLAVMSDEPWCATFVGRAPPRPGRAESTLLVRRSRFVGQGMREDLRVENLADEPAAVRILLEVDADFADLFEVKESRVPRRPRPDVTTSPDGMQLVRHYGGATSSRGVLVSAPDAVASTAGLLFDVVVPARDTWRTTVQALPVLDGAVLEAKFPSDRPLTETVAAQRWRQWREKTPFLTTHDPSLARTLERSRVDLGALRIFDPEQPDVTVVAAGAPWFMTLFGRDSLLTSYMALPVDQSLALGTLKTLARLQGQRVDQASEEQPGRILHEVRFGAEPSLALGGRTVYYGTADATPLYVVLLGELRRWGIDRDQVDALLPHAERALQWVLEYGDRDGDLFVEYQRATDRGLANQGWKDSWDGVNFADGTIPEGPIALCEVQGYCYAAFLARAHFAWEDGDSEGHTLWSRRAARLKEAFNETFWLPDQGYFAMALDGAKRPVDALASNMGHCLWSGIVDHDKAAAVAERLLSPEMFTGWGVRTLATSMSRYNPMSYHNGSVWPHDSALVAAGLMRYGFVTEAQRIACGLFDAADVFGGRLPELFCGFDRSEYPRPVPFPTSCSPQAWAAAAPLQLMRSLLRFDPWVPHGRAWLAPAFPPGFPDFTLHNLPLAGARLSMEFAGGEVVDLHGVPDELELLLEPRPVATAVHEGGTGG
jgi:glycogen debranching enzyme